MKTFSHKFYGEEQKSKKFFEQMRKMCGEM